MCGTPYGGREHRSKRPGATALCSGNTTGASGTATIEEHHAKQHAYLLFGFTLARANARMLINEASNF